MVRRIGDDTFPVTNRSAVVVSPAEPFLDWLHRAAPTSGELTLESLQIEPTIYLLPETGAQEDAERFLRRCFDEIFVEKLNGWLRVPSAWPWKRTFKMFQNWFEWSCHSMIFDLADGDIVHGLD